MSEAVWCPRCGSDRVLTSLDLPCPNCWEGEADEDLVRRLLDETAALDDRWFDEPTRVAKSRAMAAVQLLAGIKDARSAPALREALRHPSAGVRRAAVSALVASGGDEDDLPRFIEALDDEDRDVRIRALGALAQVGGPIAADALADRVGRLEGVERSVALFALAWLRDPRALPGARRLAPDAIAADDRRVVAALLLVGDHTDLASMTQILTDDLRSRGGRGPIYHTLEWALRRSGRDAETLLARCWERAGLDPRPRGAREGVGLPRSVPRLGMAELSRTPVDDRWPPAKFGGQPDWLEAPTWPVTHDGRPLVFYGQLPLPGDPARTAYIFINEAPDAKSWAPLGDGNAVVVQPGTPPHLPTRPHATGPQLYQSSTDTSLYNGHTSLMAYQRYVRLAPSLDPPEWVLGQRTEIGDWDKIGGTPLFLQGEHTPPGSGWRWAFQFTAGWAGRELGDGAVCYGFVRDDGTAALTWDCH